MSPTFVHLHLHSEYSLVDGLITLKPLVKAVAAAGMPAVAVTDMSNLFALIKFYKTALGAGIKPIIGAELWVRRGSDAPTRLVLLCKDLTGYRNLTVLISRAYVEGQSRGVPIVQFDWLGALSAGLIALSGGREGEIGRLLTNGHPDTARRVLDEYCALFPDSFYLELVRTGRPGEDEHVRAAVELAVAAAVPLVATNDVRFLVADDFEAHEARVCIHDGRVLADPQRPRLYSAQQYLRTPAEMAVLFADLPEALQNTVEIARRCSVVLELGKACLPNFPVPAGMTVDDYFAAQSRAGLEVRLAKMFDPQAPDFAARRAPYDARLETEIGVIIQMGFPGYFLIVADFIQWAKAHAIPVGPGRGSGAGSLVAYALAITDLDPLPYDLLFERFLNPERVSMPDFDVDFCMEGRDRVIDYVAQKYGRRSVSQIATHGTMAAKAVIRDVGRVLGHPYGFVDRVAKLVPLELGITLADALAKDEDFRRAYDEDEEVKALVDLAQKLEGLARNVGKHAGGVVIAPTVLTDFSPLYCEEGGEQLVTQFDKDDVEAAGLVKFDFLGLRTLTIIDWALATINRGRTARGEAPLDIMSLPLDDVAAFELVKRCETTAVFQLESRGMKDLIRRLQPDCFEDVIALVALFRPGPLESGMVDDFINRKHGRARVEYPFPELEPILKPTYGVIVYQEQVMQIPQVLAGYTLGGADLLRRAMGKKKPEEMAKQRDIFVSGTVEHGHDRDRAGALFDLMEKFAGYGFNKSHSAAYALVSYQTAWLKAHHPAAFMAAVLSSDMDKTDKVVVFIEECRRMRLAVVPPSVNVSEYKFTVSTTGEVVYGLGAVKGVGEGAVEAIIAERSAGGPYTDLADLCRRVDLKKLNRRVLESLIRAGAFDCLGDTRASLMAQLPEALRLAEQHTRNADTGQDDLFGLLAAGPAVAAPLERPRLPEWDDETRLAGEKETLGLYLTGHPVDRFLAEFKQFTSGRLTEVVEEAEAVFAAPGARRYGKGAERAVTIAGLVVDIRIKQGARGRMAFITLDDRGGRLEVRVFSETYEAHRHLLAVDRVLVIEAALAWDEFSEGVRCTAAAILDIDAARERLARRLRLQLDARRGEGDVAARLAETLGAFREGQCRVVAEVLAAGARGELVFGDDWRVRPTEELIRRLNALAGEGAVALEYR
ncbi:DNA polymerase III alpha subunit [Plasticicumulans lactativorans]|uniref:DNA polymerase III subunit alpha n=1 Tax=Plasticicumulans lactativorans TaxID=1133106 RepID=A0A4R2L687_9GAMM|nr:DNA polymerase III subunit alpha [Plasticicumulans lactativorans]TCO81989.1 DNA polymerase III alpha subunit [Plasticicumulans lactativorans]